MFLNSIKPFINKDFIYFKVPQDNMTLINNILTGDKIFQQVDNQIHHVSYNQETEQVYFERCLSIISLDELDSITKELKENMILLIQDSNNGINGYMTTSDLSNYFHCQSKQLQAFIDTLLKTTDESITAVDSEKHVIGWTKGAEKLFNVKKEEIINKPINEFFKSNHLEILNTLKGLSVQQKQHKAQENKVVLINSNPIYMDDSIIGAVVAETDITHQVTLYNELYNTTEKLFNLEREVTKLTDENDPFHSIRGSSNELNKTVSKIKKAAVTDASILIQGESGVGKELFAKAIHQLRENKEAPFIAINCGAIPESLFESEIFGYEKGAFSGANQKGKKGKVELARNGTLFLDEIAEMPLDMQVKLLRLLQEKKFYPVGGTYEMEVDFRVVAATNKSLQKLVEEGKFREDLFYRLNVVSVDIPPLRERPTDIIELTHYFLNETSIKYNRPIHGFTQPVMQALLQHEWPGNVRELQNVVERLVIFSENGDIKTDDLPFKVDTNQTTSLDHTNSLSVTGDNNQSLSDQLLEVEKNILKQELIKADNNKLKCAENLQITRATLYNRLKKVGL